MRTISFDDKNFSITLPYVDLQKILKETVETTLKMVNEKAKQKENQKWFDTKTTAEMFGVNSSTINRWKHSGYLTPRTIGGRDFFSIDQISQVLISNSKKCA